MPSNDGKPTAGDPPSACGCDLWDTWRYIWTKYSTSVYEPTSLSRILPIGKILVARIEEYSSLLLERPCKSAQRFFVQGEEIMDCADSYQYSGQWAHGDLSLPILKSTRCSRNRSAPQITGETINASGSSSPRNWCVRARNATSLR